MNKLSHAEADWAYRLPIKDRTCKLVFAQLCDAYQAGQGCYPSIARIAERIVASARTVQRTIKRLECQGLVKMVPVAGRANKYEINFGWVPLTYDVTPDILQSPVTDIVTPPLTPSVTPDIIVSPLTNGDVTPDKSTMSPLTLVSPPPDTRCHPNSYNSEENSKKNSDSGELVDLEFPGFLDRRKPKAKPSAERGYRLPADWKPNPDLVEFASGLGLDAAAVSAEFRDYWLGVPGQKGRKIDWDGTFRNRCRAKSENRRGSTPLLNGKSESWEERRQRENMEVIKRITQ